MQATPLAAERLGNGFSTNKAPPNICSLILTVWPITKISQSRSVFIRTLFLAAGEQELYQGTTRAGMSG